MHEESFFADPRNWVLIAFFLFFIIFGRKLWSALAQMLDDRAAKVRAELEEAARLRREAEAMLRDAEARRAEALREAQALIEGAKAEAGRVAAAAAAEAEASARRREQMALDRIAAAEKAAVDEVRLTAVEVATTAARQVIAEGLSADADSRLIDHAITQLPGALSGPAGGLTSTDHTSWLGSRRVTSAALADSAFSLNRRHAGTPGGRRLHLRERTMANVVTIEAEARARAGKGAARATRRAGKVPGVIYGARQAPTLIALEPRAVLRELQRAGWQSRLYEIKSERRRDARADPRRAVPSGHRRAGARGFPAPGARRAEFACRFRCISRMKGLARD